MQNRFRVSPKETNSSVAAEELAGQKLPLQNSSIPPTFKDGHIDLFLRRRVCARCYHDLVKHPAPRRLWYALCPDCLDAWHYATISRRTAELRGQQAILDYFEIRFNPALADLFPRPWRSERQILSELGYL